MPSVLIVAYRILEYCRLQPLLVQQQFIVFLKKSFSTPNNDLIRFFSGTFHSAEGGTFVSDTAGTFIPILSAFLFCATNALQILDSYKTKNSGILYLSGFPSLMPRCLANLKRYFFSNKTSPITLFIYYTTIHHIYRQDNLIDTLQE